MTSTAVRTRNFRFLISAVGTSAIGSRVTRTALPMTAVLRLDATPMELGALSVLGVLPGALGGAAIAPRLVRRFGAERVVIVSLLSGAAAQIFIPLAPAEPRLAALFLTLSSGAADRDASRKTPLTPSPSGVFAPRTAQEAFLVAPKNPAAV